MFQAKDRKILIRHGLNEARPYGLKNIIQFYLGPFPQSAKGNTLYATMGHEIGHIPLNKLPKRAEDQVLYEEQLTLYRENCRASKDFFYWLGSEMSLKGLLRDKKLAEIKKRRTETRTAAEWETTLLSLPNFQLLSEALAFKAVNECGIFAGRKQVKKNTRNHPGIRDVYQGNQEILEELTDQVVKRLFALGGLGMTIAQISQAVLKDAEENKQYAVVNCLDRILSRETEKRKLFLGLDASLASRSNGKMTEELIEELARREELRCQIRGLKMEKVFWQTAEELRNAVLSGNSYLLDFEGTYGPALQYFFGKDLNRDSGLPEDRHLCAQCNIFPNSPLSYEQLAELPPTVQGTGVIEENGKRGLKYPRRKDILVGIYGWKQGLMDYQVWPENRIESEKKIAELAQDFLTRLNPEQIKQIEEFFLSGEFVPVIDSSDVTAGGFQKWLFYYFIERRQKERPQEKEALEKLRQETQEKLRLFELSAEYQKHTNEVN